VLAMFQALNAGKIISKDLLFKDVRPQDREEHGERFLLGFVDKDLNADPYFYENRHLSPQPVTGSSQPGGEESWIFYNTTKYSGKKLVVRPGERYSSTERGVYNLLAWSGEGRYGGHQVVGGDSERDELLVVHDAAVQPIEVENTGSEDLVIFKFFGPDINPDAPMIPPWPPVAPGA
jgi:hypothetical protein